MSNPTPEAPEVSEEQRDICKMCGREVMVKDGCPAIGNGSTESQLECTLLGYTREHERAEGLQAEIDRLFAGDEPGQTARQERDAADARAEGLAKELAEARAVAMLREDGMRESLRAAARICQIDLDAAAARVAEMQDRMVAAFGEGTDETMLVAISHEQEARVAELEKQLAAKTAEADELQRALKWPWIECPHGRSPHDRCDYCGNIDDDQARALERFKSHWPDSIAAVLAVLPWGHFGACPRCGEMHGKDRDDVCESPPAKSAAEAELARLRALPEGGDLERLKQIEKAAIELDKVLMVMWSLLPEGCWEDSPYSSVAVEGHVLHGLLAAPLPSAQQIPAPATPPKCAAKIHFDGRDYTCGGKHDEADHNRLLGESAAAGKPLDSPLIPITAPDSAPVAARILSLSSEDEANLNPGVRRLVVFLRANGFDTYDSGDGVTHEFANDNDFPYVNIGVAADRMTVEADRLLAVMMAAGVALGPENETGTAPSIATFYSPFKSEGHPAATITLLNVTDSILEEQSRAPLAAKMEKP